MLDLAARIRSSSEIRSRVQKTFIKSSDLSNLQPRATGCGTTRGGLNHRCPGDCRCHVLLLVLTAGHPFPFIPPLIPRRCCGNGDSGNQFAVALLSGGGERSAQGAPARRLEIFQCIGAHSRVHWWILEGFKEGTLLCLCWFLSYLKVIKVIRSQIKSNKGRSSNYWNKKQTSYGTKTKKAQTVCKCVCVCVWLIKESIKLCSNNPA